jgi:hypothetical protein
MRIIEMTVFGIASKFETKVLNPMFLKVRVKYCLGVIIGVSKVRPIMYRGQRSKSQRLFHSSFGVIGCRLCIVPLLGSSRITRLTRIVSSLTRRQIKFPVGFGCPQMSLPWCEPAILAARPVGGLAGSWGH